MVIIVMLMSGNEIEVRFTVFVWNHQLYSSQATQITIYILGMTD